MSILTLSHRSVLLRNALDSVSSAHQHRLRSAVLEGAAQHGSSHSVPSQEALLQVLHTFHVHPLMAYNAVRHGACRRELEALTPFGVGAGGSVTERDALRFFIRVVETELAGCTSSGDVSLLQHTPQCPLDFPLAADVAIVLVALMAYVQRHALPMGAEAVDMLQSLFDECAEDSSNADMDTSSMSPSRDKMPQLQVVDDTKDGPTQKRVRWSTLQTRIREFCSSSMRPDHLSQSKKTSDDSSPFFDEIDHSADLGDILLDAMGVPLRMSGSPVGSPVRSTSLPQESSTEIPDDSMWPEGNCFVTFAEFLQHLKDYSFADAKQKRKAQSSAQRRRSSIASREGYDDSADEASMSGAASPPSCDETDVFDDLAVFDLEPLTLDDSSWAKEFSNKTNIVVTNDDADILDAMDASLSEATGDALSSAPRISLDGTFAANSGRAALTASINGVSGAPMDNSSFGNNNNNNNKQSLSTGAGGDATPRSVTNSTLEPPLAASMRKSIVKVRALTTASGRRRALSPHASPSQASPATLLTEKVEASSLRISQARQATSGKIDRFMSFLKGGIQIMETNGETKAPLLAHLRPAKRLTVGYAPSLTVREEDKKRELLDAYNVDHSIEVREENQRREGAVAKERILRLKHKRRLQTEMRIQEETSSKHSLVAQEDAFVCAIALASLAAGKANDNKQHALRRKSSHALESLRMLHSTLSGDDVVECDGIGRQDHRPLPTPSPGPGEHPASRVRAPSSSHGMCVGNNIAAGTSDTSGLHGGSLSPSRFHGMEERGEYNLLVDADTIGTLRCLIKDVYCYADLLEALEDTLMPCLVGTPQRHNKALRKHQQNRSLADNGVRDSRTLIDSRRVMSSKQRVSDVFLDVSHCPGTSPPHFIPLADISELPRLARVKVLVC